MVYLLFISVFVISTCGLVYELIAGALASYLLGDSITQFSTVIGVYLFSMGIGSFLSKYANRNLISIFVQVEILIGLIGGFSASLLFLLFEHVSSFRLLLYALVALTGILVGLEIPLLMRILKDQLDFKDLVARVFTFDYVGALLASLLFPLILVPHLGLVRSSFLFGILNVLVGVWTLVLFKKEVVWAKLLRGFGILALVLLLFGFVYSETIMTWAEANTYPDKVIYSKSSSFQRIVLTHSKRDLRLFLNGNLQFSSRDEYRYHEPLVHIGMSSLDSPRNILVLGGGDGLAVREILRYPSVKTVTLVDLDPEITRLFKTHDTLSKLNESSLRSAKVKLINSDAFIWAKENHETFDFIVVDFPDPSNYSVGKLYTNTFYRVLHRALRPDGALVIQSTSPFVARKSYWCICKTLESVGFLTQPYHSYVPSFGDWGYILASKKPLPFPRTFPDGLRFLDINTAKSMLSFSPDMNRVDTEVNKLNNQILVRYFEDEWSAYIH